MVRRHLWPAIATATLLVIGGAVLSAALGDGPVFVDTARGALVGVTLLIGAIVLLVARSADGRGIAASQLESELDSVEQQVWREASSRTCADAVGVFAFVAIVCLWAPGQGLARWLPAAGFLGLVIDLAVRARLSWLKRAPGDA